MEDDLPNVCELVLLGHHIRFFAAKKKSYKVVKNRKDPVVRPDSYY
jgi:hypothetical protein